MKPSLSFPVIVTASVSLLVILVVVFVVIVNLRAGDVEANVKPSSSNIESDTGAIRVGEGDQTIETYIDFMCPGCKQFEDDYREVIDREIQNGTITLRIFPVAILNRLSLGTDYSSRAANAMYCVAESAPDASWSFVEQMYAHQPKEKTEGLSNDVLVHIAELSGAPGLESCIDSEKYVKYVESVTSTLPTLEDGSAGTPTIRVNEGDPMGYPGLPSPEELIAMLD